MQKAMNLTYGDFIIIEVALLLYLKDMDLSMQCGQYMSELLGKIEYALSQIKEAAEKQLGPALRPESELEIKA